MKTSKSINPLIFNYVTPTEPKVIISETNIVYDPIEQIPLYMGGDSGKPSKTGNPYSVRRTDEYNPNTNTQYSYTDDPRHTDD